MLFLNTKLQLIDNSSAKIAKIIQLRKNKKLKFSKIINVIVKKIINKTKLNNKIIYLSIITHTKIWILGIDHFLIKFETNNSILLDNSYKLLFTKLNIPLIKNFYHKILLNQKLYQKLIIFSKNYF